jgi:FkbM family methyltransferase
MNPLATLSRLLPASAKERIKTRLGVPGQRASLSLLRDNGFAPAVVLDVGAFEGEWTLLCKEFWPDAAVLMVEPLPHKAPALTALSDRLPGVRFVPALLGPTARQDVPFYVCETASSVLAEPAHPQPVSIRIDMTTLDELVHETPFRHLSLLKVDVQGYELEVLKGGAACLAAAEVLLLEVNLLPIYADAPLAHDLVHFLHLHGFQLYDICTLYRRPYDGALWQIDAIFVRSSSPLVVSNRWS